MSEYVRFQTPDSFIPSKSSEYASVASESSGLAGSGRLSDPDSTYPLEPQVTFIPVPVRWPILLVNFRVTAHLEKFRGRSRDTDGFVKI